MKLNFKLLIFPFRFQFPEIQTPTSHKKIKKKQRQALKKFDDFQDFIGPYIRHLESLVSHNICY